MEKPETGNRPDLYQTELERHLFGLEDHRGRSRITELLEQLPDLYREVVLLRDKERLRYVEIAEHLRVPVGTVKSRLHRARKALHRLLREIDELGDSDAQGGQ